MSSIAAAEKPEIQFDQRVKDPANPNENFAKGAHAEIPSSFPAIASTFKSSNNSNATNDPVPVRPTTSG